MPRIPRHRAVAAPDWRKALGALLFAGGALLCLGDLMRSMGSS